MSVEIGCYSGMTFMAAHEDDFFKIETSKVLTAMGEGVQTVEFIIYTGTQLRLVEAKTTIRESNIEDICNKFIHSLDLFFAIMLGRKEDTFSEIPDKIKTVDIKHINIVLLLVIKECHKKNDLTPITEKLNRNLKRHRKTWNLEAKAIDHKTAVDWKLAKEA